MESAIYVGTLRHRRFIPVRHQFTYPLFMVFLDIDRLPELMRVSPLAGYARWNWASYYEEDHFGDPRQPLRERLAEDARRRGVELPDGQIFLLTNLRYLGHNFNPVSFYYCYDRAEMLRLVLAEVNNTFGETENYWMAVGQELPAGENRKYRFKKSFYVSPFMGLAQEYEWTFTPPSQRLISQCVSYEDGRGIFDASLKLERRAWSRHELHRTLTQYPWVTLKVVAGIHWEALKLYFKRVPLLPHPGPGRYTKATTKHWGASW